MASAISCAVYVLVAATDFSSPTVRRMQCWLAWASGDSGSLVMASVTPPCLRASATTRTMSGDRPDWLMPMVRARARRGAAPYRVNSDGAASPTDRPLKAPNRYWA